MANYLLCFINILINGLQKGKDHEDKSFIIPLDLFGITKPFIFIQIPSVNSVKLIHFTIY